MSERWLDHWTAQTYDTWTSPFQRWRDMVVEAAPLTEGDVVVDVGCGTGLCFARLTEKVGCTGRVLGVDPSGQMLEIARHRVVEHGWPQVTLVHSPAATARLPVQPDAAVFCAVHEVLQDDASLDNLIGQMRPDAWVGAVGGKWAHPSLVALNLLVLSIHTRYVQDFRGFHAPWAVLTRHLARWRVTELAGGTGYLLVGRTPAATNRCSVDLTDG